MNPPNSLFLPPFRLIHSELSLEVENAKVIPNRIKLIMVTAYSPSWIRYPKTATQIKPIITDKILCPIVFLLQNKEVANKFKPTTSYLPQTQ